MLKLIYFTFFTAEFMSVTSYY